VDLVPDGEGGTRTVPRRRVLLRYDALAADHLVRRHLPREQAWHHDRLEPVLLLGRPRLELLGRPQVPLLVPLGPVLSMTTTAERERLALLARERQKAEDEQRQRERDWQASPQVQQARIRDLESRVKELEAKELATMRRTP
jgi:hypothetical protein